MQCRRRRSWTSSSCKGSSQQAYQSAKARSWCASACMHSAYGVGWEWCMWQCGQRQSMCMMDCIGMQSMYKWTAHPCSPCVHGLHRYAVHCKWTARIVCSCLQSMYARLQTMCSPFRIGLQMYAVHCVDCKCLQSSVRWTVGIRSPCVVDCRHGLWLSAVHRTVDCRSLQSICLWTADIASHAFMDCMHVQSILSRTAGGGGSKCAQPRAGRR